MFYVTVIGGTDNNFFVLYTDLELACALCVDCLHIHKIRTIFTLYLTLYVHVHIVNHEPFN